MEKSKALLLYDELSNLRRLQSLKIPDSLLSKERKLRNNINRLENLRFKNADSLKTTIAYQDSLNNITKTIIKEYSNYKEIDTNFSYSPISEIQEKLTSDQAILEYHISADNGFGLAPNTDTGYGLFITKDRSLLFEINDLPEIKTLSNDLLSKIRTKQRNSSENQEFIKSSRHLYNKLIPEQIRENLKNKKITIIPDNYLSELPFEALVINKAEDPLTYFIETNEIHYLYSLSFQELNEKGMSTISRKHNISAFAPVSFTALPSLDNTDREVKRIQDHLNGTVFLGESASKANFISILKDSEIIHLATHAKATDDNPWIEFFDERIYLNELNTLSNNASLVVLSACETTTGEIADGEGVLSLARGFFYGGAQATVSSLWQVDDKSTYFIMDQFYKNLSEGSTKSSSLRNAKLTYINNHSGSELSPYYWSSFILTGSIDPISQEKYYWVYALTIGLGVLIVLFTLSRKRK